MWHLYWKRFKSNPLMVTGAGIVLLLILIATFGPYLVSNDPMEQHLLDRLQPPSLNHWLGTDELGRDVLSRVILGARVSLLIGFLVSIIAIFVGTTMGLISGYFRGWVDSFIMRFVEVMLCFPFFYLILMILAMVEKPTIYIIMIVLAIGSWPALTRMVRGQVLREREKDFMLVAKGLGLSTPRILFVHLLPNVLTPVIVAATLTVGGAILAESALSFLGLGVQPPQPSWGNILLSGKQFIHVAWWLSVFPGVAIFITVLGFNFLGEGLRDVLDPRVQ